MFVCKKLPIVTPLGSFSHSKPGKGYFYDRWELQLIKAIIKIKISKLYIRLLYALIDLKIGC